MAWFRWSVACLSPWMNGFKTRQFYVEFVVDQMAQEYGFFRGTSVFFIRIVFSVSNTYVMIY